MQADTMFWDSFVFDGIDDVDVEAVTAAFGTVDVTARGRGVSAACPDCGRSSTRVHDSYQRRLKDLPLAGQSVVIHLTVRRFICSTTTCPRRTFAEPFTQLTAPHARFTTRLSHVLERVGLALAGRAGARLTAHLGFSVGRMTMLRRVMALPDPQPSTPRVLGVDDFATRRGQTYATVLTCGETHRVVDVLPTRDSGPLAAWLATHPGVEPSPTAPTLSTSRTSSPSAPRPASWRSCQCLRAARAELLRHGAGPELSQVRDVVVERAGGKRPAASRSR
ncbi:transposase family protein [Streptomyces mauvecolor]|uniref:Transposase family protein n=1 Tax=Streptomyces mauvecolor TaxID=58345 RepID=A0ABV9UU37_9ACTN